MDIGEVALKVMAVGVCWFGIIAIPTIIVGAFAGPGRGVDIIQACLPFALLGLAPFFAGLMIFVFALMRDGK